MTTVYHPQANGMVERHNASLKKVVHAAIAERKDPKKAVKEFTFAYRNTPHSTTGQKPSLLFFNRDLKGKLPSIPKTTKGRHHEQAREKIKEAKEKSREYTDRKRRAKDTALKEGDKVMIRQKSTTTKPPWNPSPYTITKVLKTKVYAEREGEIK